MKIRMDNSTEFISLTQALRVEEYGVILEFIKPGKPAQNTLTENEIKLPIVSFSPTALNMPIRQNYPDLIMVQFFCSLTGCIT